MENEPGIDDAYFLARDILADKCKARFFDFFCEFWDTIVPDDLVLNWHIEYLCDELQTIFEKMSKGIPQPDTIINVPPGTSKTTICTILFPAWCWTVRARTRILSGSYSAALAIEHSVKSRDVLKSPKYRSFYGNHIQFKPDMDNKGYYQNEKHGTRISTSVGGTATGRHADIIIMDDPIDAKKAASEVERKTANDWGKETLSSRKTDKKITPTIYIMQRLHEDDPTGFKMASDQIINHICLPAELTELDNVRPKILAKKYKKGLLDPKRLDRVTLDKQKASLGEIGYGGQYLQSPKAADGNVFKRHWFQTYDELPRTKTLRRLDSWDTAFKKGQENDPSCRTTWIEYESGYYLVDFFMEKLEYPELKQEIVLSHAKNRPHVILIEDKASGISANQELLRLKLPIKPIVPLTDKVARANQVTPTFEAKNVFFPVAEYTKLIVDQLTGFPNTKHDDIVDSITQALNYMLGKQTGPLILASAGRRGVISTRGF